MFPPCFIPVYSETIKASLLHCSSTRLITTQTFSDSTPLKGSSPLKLLWPFLYLFPFTAIFPVCKHRKPLTAFWMTHLETKPVKWHQYFSLSTPNILPDASYKWMVSHSQRHRGNTARAISLPFPAAHFCPCAVPQCQHLHFSSLHFAWRTQTQNR